MRELPIRAQRLARLALGDSGVEATVLYFRVEEITMLVSRLIAAAAMPLMLSYLPISVTAQQQIQNVAQATAPSPDQVKSAVKQALMSVGLTRRQKLEVKSMVQNYESQTANADDATKQTAQKTLLKNIYGILTPAQQTQFKASIKQSLGADVQSP